MLAGLKTWRNCAERLDPKSPMEVLVVGYGSSGRRYATLLSQLGCSPTIASRRLSPEIYRRIASGEERMSKFDRVLLCTESSEHSAFLENADLREFSGSILIDKPAILSKSVVLKLNGIEVRVAYNLRYLDAVWKLRDALRGEPIVRASARCLTYLPSWRSERHVSETYSALLSLGGGALNDLAHEFDYLTLLIGDWTVLAANGGRLGDVTVDADDSWGILGRSNVCGHIEINLSLISRLNIRDLTVETPRETFHLDFNSGELRTSEESFSGNKVGETYLPMLEDFLSNSPGTRLPSLGENALTLKRINEVREASI